MKDSDFCLYVAGVFNRQFGCGGIGLAETLAALEGRRFQLAVDALRQAWLDGQEHCQLFVPEDPAAVRARQRKLRLRAKELRRLLGDREPAFRRSIRYLPESEWDALVRLLCAFRAFRQTAKAA